MKETLTELRSRFWIVRGRQVVKKLLHEYTICRRLQGRPYSPPTAPSLPSLKITKEQPFTRWRNEYLLELRNSHRLKTRDAEGQTVAVGDVGIVHEDGLHQGLWKLGRVESLIKGKDGLVRGAVVKSTSPKKRNPTTKVVSIGTWRSFTRGQKTSQLCLLELSMQRCSPDGEQHAQQT